MESVTTGLGDTSGHWSVSGDTSDDQWSVSLSVSVNKVEMQYQHNKREKQVYYQAETDYRPYKLGFPETQIPLEIPYVYTPILNN